MDAQTPKAEELSLPEAFLILATNDIDGEPELPPYLLRIAVAGAILAELDLLGAIELQGKNVRATGTEPQTHLQHELEIIRHKSRPHSPERWVSMLEGRAEVQRVYESLASRGIVDKVGEKHLGVFKIVRYPEKDHAPEAALLKRIESALSDGRAEPASGPSAADSEPAQTAHAETDPRTRALIALLHAAGLLEKLFPAAHQNRIQDLTGDYWPSRAVQDELRDLRLAAEPPV
ncbi:MULTISPECIES: GPP34 family phosphoprotein [unclassified Arthrobacter]|uniref:GOLPH3/VPS74 family protein n=1 Tax=unclassified Arthrobacter TaxID=235627 RepID=UPI0033958396